MLECCLHVGKGGMVWSPIRKSRMGLYAVPSYIIHYHWSFDQCNRAWKTLATSRHITSALFSSSLPNQVYVLEGMDPVMQWLMPFLLVNEEFGSHYASFCSLVNNKVLFYCNRNDNGYCFNCIWFKDQ